MKARSLLIPLMFALALDAAPALAAGTSGFGLTLLVDDAPRPEFVARGKVYVEAVRDREYTLRITNPLPCRVAVALSVDGLNTINARRTDARSASKWVLGPYETITISGWQMNGSEARKFYFTGEKKSYGAWLGQTDSLGVIEAVFFKEVPPPPPVHVVPDTVPGSAGSSGLSRSEAPAPSLKREPSAEAQSKSSAGLSDEYAATGIGRKVDHDIEWVRLDLERDPSAVVRIRYEYHPQLVRLGVLPSPRPCPDPLDRREVARGFSGSYCPDPFGGRN